MKADETVVNIDKIKLDIEALSCPFTFATLKNYFFIQLYALNAASKSS